jgi:hypothetical protein
LQTEKNPLQMNADGKHYPRFLKMHPASDCPWALIRCTPSAKLIVLPNAEHDAYRSNEAEVLSEMKAFLGYLP